MNLESYGIEVEAGNWKPFMFLKIIPDKKLIHDPYSISEVGVHITHDHWINFERLIASKTDSENEWIIKVEIPDVRCVINFTFAIFAHFNISDIPYQATIWNNNNGQNFTIDVSVDMIKRKAERKSVSFSDINVIHYI